MRARLLQSLGANTLKVGPFTFDTTANRRGPTFRVFAHGQNYRAAWSAP